MISCVGPQHGRILYAYMEGFRLMIRQSPIYSFETRDVDVLDIFSTHLLSRPVEEVPIRDQRPRDSPGSSPRHSPRNSPEKSPEKENTRYHSSGMSPLRRLPFASDQRRVYWSENLPMFPPRQWSVVFPPLRSVIRILVSFCCTRDILPLGFPLYWILALFPCKKGPFAFGRGFFAIEVRDKDTDPITVVRE